MTAPLSVDQRLNQLSSQLAALTTNGVVRLTRQPVSPETAVGSAVYWNTTNNRWEPARAVAVSGTQGTPDPSSDVAAIVAEKFGTSAADLVVLGLWAPDTLPSMIDDGAPGRYYLSPSVAGGWTKTRPSVIARPIGFVLRGPIACDSRPLLFVAPLSSDWQNDHQHYEFALTALPAGQHDPPEPYDAHVITSPNASLPGWLPANHAIFNGNAPVGAKFGYNLSQHAALAAVWPPQPLTAVCLDQTSDFENTRLMGRVPPEYVKFDANGIWWMTDGHGHVPWPTNYDTVAPDANYDVFTTPGTPSVGMHLRLSFVRTTLSTVQTVVTSLRPAPESPITVKTLSGVDGVSGDLMLGLDLNLLTNLSNVEGHLAVKGFTNGKFDKGPVTEGLIAGSAGVTLSSDTTRAITVGGEPKTLYMGRVSIALAGDQANAELFPHISAVGDAVERLRFDIPYLSLPAGRKSELIFRMHIPAAGMGSGQLKMRFRAVLFGTVTGTLDELDCRVRRIARPTSPVAINVSPVSLPGFVTAAAVTADNAIELQSEQFNVAHGDTIVVAITRNSGGAYAGEVGFLRTCGIVST